MSGIPTGSNAGNKRGYTKLFTLSVRDSVVANFATTAANGKIDLVDYYKLDVLFTIVF